MSSLGAPDRRTRTVEELLREAYSSIREIQIKQLGIKTEIPTVVVSINETVLLTHSEPVVTLQNTSTGLYDGGSNYDDVVVYA